MPSDQRILASWLRAPGSAEHVKRNSPAQPTDAAVEMEMIVVFWVEVRSQDDAEVSTSAGMSGPQKARFRALAAPLPAYGDVMPVCQREAADINGIGDGVLAAPVLPELGANDVAAGVGAEALHRHDALAKGVLRRLLHVVGQPQRERGCGLAGDLVEAGAHALRAAHADGIGPAATVLQGTIGDGLYLDVRSDKNAPTQLRIVLHRREPPVRERRAWLSEVDGGQRVQIPGHQALAEGQGDPAEDNRAEDKKDE